MQPSRLFLIIAICYFGLVAYFALNDTSMLVLRGVPCNLPCVLDVNVGITAIENVENVIQPYITNGIAYPTTRGGVYACIFEACPSWITFSAGDDGIVTSILIYQVWGFANCDVVYELQGLPQVIYQFPDDQIVSLFYLDSVEVILDTRSPNGSPKVEYIWVRSVEDNYKRLQNLLQQSSLISWQPAQTNCKDF